MSTKGGRFLEPKKDDSEEMKKTYINLKPLRKYRFHWHVFVLSCNFQQPHNTTRILYRFSYETVTNVFVLLFFFILEWLTSTSTRLLILFLLFNCQSYQLYSRFSSCIYHVHVLFSCTYWTIPCFGINLYILLSWKSHCCGLIFYFMSYANASKWIYLLYRVD